MYNAFNAQEFKNKVSRALEKVKTILDINRHPQIADEVQHQYEDKYLLAENLINLSSTASLNALEAIGVTEKHLAQMREWAKTRSVSLRFRASATCKFLRKVEREVQSDTTHVHTSTVFGTSKSYTVTKVTEWFWQYDAKWEVIAFQGNAPQDGISITGRSGTVELKTSADATPRPVSHVESDRDVNITWLLKNTDEKRNGTFKIDRSEKSCHTPRRNDDVEAALTHARTLNGWNDSVWNYLENTWMPIEPNHSYNMGTIRQGGIFVPVIAIFEKGQGPNALPANVTGPFLAEQKRTIDSMFADVAKVFPVNNKLITQMETKLCVILRHCTDILISMREGLDYIEDMLFKQLVAAIGKEVQPVDFTNYQRFHNRKLFRKEYQPRPFCYAIRRPEHYPEGLLSIENQLSDGSIPDPIYTSACHSVAARPMKFPINAAANVSFYGDRYLHGFVMHQFSGQSGSNLSLVARARQFSSFIVLVGTIASADTFEPKYGIIDDLKIPLNLETIPTPKEFRDAIESLSPEQQRFAKAYRGMQLESTLFGICVIQIKPQLEKLLNLDDDSLTKEIQLTQDLMSLFIEYQIPCDLISYDGDKNAEPTAKVERVKELVGRMLAMIKRSKEKELAEERARQAQLLAQAPVPIPPSEGAAPLVLLSKSVAAAPTAALRSRGGGAMRPMMAGPGSNNYKPTRDVGKVAPAASTSGYRMSNSAAGPTSSTVTTSTAPMPSPKPTTSPASQASLPVTETRAPTVKESPVVAPDAAVPAPKKPEVPAQKNQQLVPSGSSNQVGEVVDYTKIPQELERKFEQLDEDSALRPTIITVGNSWERKFQKALLTPESQETLDSTGQGKERNKAFDLLDAITKSGVLSVDSAELHVVIASTHCFDKSLMMTVIQDNVNPIEKVERSSLIIASTIQQKPPVELIQGEQRERIGLYSPKLLQ